MQAGLKFVEPHGARWQHFMPAQHEHSAGRYPLVKQAGNFGLKRFLKIREDQIAAQYQVKRSVRQLSADILLSEFNTSSKFRSQAAAPVALLKRGLYPAWRQVP
jgi:hypothetical protein